MFTVADIDEMVARLTRHGARLVGEVVWYENSFRLCYNHGTEGLLIGLQRNPVKNELAYAACVPFFPSQGRICEQRVFSQITPCFVVITTALSFIFCRYL
jgi:hypothetical protein